MSDVKFDLKFMKEAVKEALYGLKNDHGGPFGAVVVKDGTIVGRGHNMVTGINDPTAHAEVMAIRDACKNLNTFNLAGCEIYSSCEPCPMCLSAIYWARIDRLYYGCTRKDAAAIGFDDDALYNVFKEADTRLSLYKENICRDICMEPFIEWNNKEDKVQY